MEAYGGLTSVFPGDFHMKVPDFGLCLIIPPVVELDFHPGVAILVQDVEYLNNGLY
jgi:hypothetical protein